MKFKKITSIAVANCMALSAMMMSAGAVDTTSDTTPAVSSVEQTQATLIGEETIEQDGTTRAIRSYDIYIAQNYGSQVLAAGTNLRAGTNVEISSTLHPTSARLRLDLEYYNGSSYTLMQSYTNYKPGQTVSLYAAATGQYRIVVTGWNSATPITGVMNIDM